LLTESGGHRHARNWTPEPAVIGSSALTRKSMTERDWEHYRLSVVEQMPENPYKEASIAGIKHKLQLLDEQDPPQATPPRTESRKAAAATAAGR
jgi:hypothetical protein